MGVLDINCEVAKGCLTEFISREVASAGFERGILALSGGVDSSLVAFLSTEALGADNMTALYLPYKTSNPANERDARAVAEILGIELIKIDITPQIDLYFQSFPEADRLRRANKMARERMSIIYDHSARLKAMVIGTSNKTEILLGYGTIYGDMACGINPVGDLYKTQIRQLARYVGVPERIITKPPTADLWPGQTDEGELGFTYDEVDRLLYYLVDKGLTEEELKKLGFERRLIERVKFLMEKSSFKRRLPKVARLPKEAFAGAWETS